MSAVRAASGVVLCGAEDPVADLKKSTDANKNQIKWMWGAGAALDQSALGAPDASTTYTLCLYDSKASVPTLVGWLRYSDEVFVGQQRSERLELLG